MRRILLAAALVLGCDDGEGLDTATIGVTSSAPLTTSADDESDSSDEGSSSDESPVEPEPYGACQDDPSCHCEGATCVEPCGVDADCPGAGRCHEDGCYLQCLGETYSNGQVFWRPWNCLDGQRCGPVAGNHDVQVCVW